MYIYIHVHTLYVQYLYCCAAYEIHGVLSLCMSFLLALFYVSAYCVVSMFAVLLLFFLHAHNDFFIGFLCFLCRSLPFIFLGFDYLSILSFSNSIFLAFFLSLFPCAFFLVSFFLV